MAGAFKNSPRGDLHGIVHQGHLEGFEQFKKFSRNLRIFRLRVLAKLPLLVEKADVSLWEKVEFDRVIVVGLGQANGAFSASARARERIPTIAVMAGVEKKSNQRRFQSGSGWRIRSFPRQNGRYCRWPGLKKSPRLAARHSIAGGCWPLAPARADFLPPGALNQSDRFRLLCLTLGAYCRFAKPDPFPPAKIRAGSLRADTLAKLPPILPG